MVSLTLRRLRPAMVFVFTLLLIEFVDELVFGLHEAALPMIRDDLMLSYVQIGLIAALPSWIAYLIEPVLGILGDVWKRRVLVVGGGLCFTLAVLLTGLSHSFGMLLFATILFHPSSGAFVALSQSTLMDTDPTRHEHNMARWTFAGSVGVVAGPLLLGGFIALGYGWREPHLLIAGLALLLTWWVGRAAFPKANPEADEGTASFRDGLRQAFQALKRPGVVRWFVLVECADFMLDILYGYLALYFVDVVGIPPEQAALAVAVWTGVGLLGDLLLIPLLERVRGLTYLRYSALIELVLFPAFLLVPGLPLKLVLVGLMGLFNSGWYAILSGQIYSAMPGQSGTVMTVGTVFGAIRTAAPLLIGVVAERFGLGAAMWLMLLGPIALLIGLPRRRV